MAVSFVGVRTIMGNKRVAIGTVTFDSSYPTGGEDVNPDIFGMGTVEVVVPNDETSGRSVRWNSGTKKLQVYTAIGTEATNASDQSATKATVFAVGI
jgi:hypothetical protein